MKFSKHDDTIDSRDIIERLEELRNEIEERDELQEQYDDLLLEALEESDADESTKIQADLEKIRLQLFIANNHVERDSEEFAILEALESEASGSPDWAYGETLIRDSYFIEYAQELANDCGMIPDNLSWPLTCIDWEQAANELKYDYMAVDFDGVTYWIRG